MISISLKCLEYQQFWQMNKHKQVLFVQWRAPHSCSESDVNSVIGFTFFRTNKRNSFNSDKYIMITKPAIRDKKKKILIFLNNVCGRRWPRSRRMKVESVGCCVQVQHVTPNLHDRPMQHSPTGCPHTLPWTATSVNKEREREQGRRNLKCLYVYSCGSYRNQGNSGSRFSTIVILERVMVAVADTHWPQEVLRKFTISVKFCRQPLDWEGSTCIIVSPHRRKHVEGNT